MNTTRRSRRPPAGGWPRLRKNKSAGRKPMLQSEFLDQDELYQLTGCKGLLFLQRAAKVYYFYNGRTMRKDLEKKVVDAIFYGNNGDPVKDFIDQGEMLEALTCLFVSSSLPPISIFIMLANTASAITDVSTPSILRLLCR